MALSLGKSVGPTSSERSAGGCSDKSEELPGPCRQSQATPAMGAMVIEHGYKFDGDGFHEVGSLDITVAVPGGKTSF